jgi:hypothetical protein
MKVLEVLETEDTLESFTSTCLAVQGNDCQNTPNHLHKLAGNFNAKPNPTAIVSYRETAKISH